MIHNTDNIPAFLISEDNIRKQLSSVFVDSIVVDSDFRIRLVSQNVLDYLSFKHDELFGKKINYLAGNIDIDDEMHREIRHGHFDERRYSLFSKDNRKVDVGISGFYLGLISDINGRIILRIKKLDEIDSLSQQLEHNKAELDNFVYRAAHDLRGPLATIKGLVNLLKMRENFNDVDKLVQLIDAHADKMDERLFQLVYLSQLEKEGDVSNNILDFGVLETRLRKIIEKNAFVDFLELHVSAPKRRLSGLNELSIYTLSENLLLYILSLSMNRNQSQIFFRIEKQKRHVEITVAAQGFEISDSVQDELYQHDFIYTDLIKYPKMINLYAAQKIAGQLNTKIKITVISKENQRMTIRIPIPNKKF